VVIKRRAKHGREQRNGRRCCVPPGFQFDEAYNAFDALRVVAGARPLFLEANGGREVLYTYLQAALVLALGANAFALRLTSAVVGLATVPLTYLFVRSLPLRQRRWVAGLTTLILALSYWHIHFSRYGIRAITLPPLEVLTFLFFLQGIRKRSLLPFGLSGLWLGLTAYAHPASRLVPIILTLFVLYMACHDRAGARTYLMGWAIAGTVSLIVFAPLGLYFLDHPHSFSGHPGVVSIFDPRVHQGNLPKALLLNVLRVAGMFSFRGDTNWTHNLAGRPVFDPFLSLCLLLGLPACLSDRLGRRTREERQAFVFLLLWIGVMLIPSVLSDGAPNFSRTIGSLPALFVLPALGIIRFGRWVVDRQAKPGSGPLSGWLAGGMQGRLILSVVLIAGLIFGTLCTVRDYFVVFPSQPDTYYNFDMDKLDVVAYLEGATREGHVYLPPLWAEQATIAFLTRNLPLRSFESSDAVVIPSRGGGDAIYAFPAEQEDHIDRLAKAFGPVGERYEVMDRLGEPLLLVYRVPEADLPEPYQPLENLRRYGDALRPQQVSEAQFEGDIQLLGYSLPSESKADHPLTVKLFWRAARNVGIDYTIFVHLLDDRGRQWGQHDKQPANGSYPSSVWRAGDIVVDRYHPVVTFCAPPGTYRPQVGLYSLATGKRLRLTDSHLTSLSLAGVEVEPAHGRSAAEVSPGHLLEARLGPGIRLLGYEGDRWEVRQGDSLSLALYLQSSDNVREDRTLFVALRAGGSEQWAYIWQWEPPVPTSWWARDEVFCTYRDLEIPADLPPGDYDAWVGLIGDEGSAVALSTVSIAEQVRRFELPHPQYPMRAELGGVVAFLGYDLEETSLGPGDTLHLTLYWQAQKRMGKSYTVFTHLLDTQNQIWGQKDNVPVSGSYPTTDWWEGEVVFDEYEIPVRTDAPAGEYRIEIGIYDAMTGERLSVFTSQGQQLSDRILLETRVKVMK
jgi:hypothetical protein